MVYFQRNAHNIKGSKSILFFLFVKTERWPIYYTGQVCELDEFGLKFGFFESVLKTRYEGILYCLNIKASISQKKFFLTTHQNFLTFFQKLRG